MSTYTAIANGEIDTDSPITANLMTKIRDNPLAVAQGDPTALAAGEGVAIDYDFGSGSQTAIITDETDTTKVLQPDGSGSVAWGFATKGGGGLDTPTQYTSGLNYFIRHAGAETLVGFTTAAISDAIGGIGLVATASVNRVTMVASAVDLAQTRGLRIREDQGGGTIVTLKSWSGSLGRTADPCLTYSGPIVAGRKYFAETFGTALPGSSGTLQFAITW